MLVNGEDGVLSFGGSAAAAIEMVETQTKAQLDSLEVHAEQPPPPVEKIPPLVKRGRTSKGIAMRQPDWDDGWTWTDVQGAEGWWQVLMQGVWVDGSRVLKNQAVVVDVRVPPALTPKSLMILNLKTDQQPLHPRAPSRRQSLLRLHIRLPPTTTTIFQLLRLPMPQSTKPSLRIWRRKIPIHARWPRRRLVWYSRWEIQPG